MSTVADNRFLCFGAEELPPAPMRLRAGPLNLEFADGGLRYIRLGEHELVRRVYAAVRDRNWGTVPARLSIVREEVREDSFEIVCEAECRQGEIDFFWRGTIRGEASGRIFFGMDGQARSTFLRNRIGFCVLHPPKDCRGARCRVGQQDGTTIEAVFPRLISPWSPFKDMTSIEHEVCSGLWCRVGFEGDLFEMEDQRNWADASFKTFCTPLSIPFPAQVAAGSVVRQSVTVSVDGALPGSARSETRAKDSVVRIAPSSQPVRPLPPIGLGAASHEAPLSAREIEILRQLRPAHLRVDLRLAEANYAARLKTACSDAVALQVPLEVAVFVTNEAERELAGLAQHVAALRPEVCRWLVLRTGELATQDPRWCELARKHLAGSAPRALFGTGTDHSFVEINRRRPPATGIDFVGFSANPQVHAFDHLSLVETLGTLGELVECAREFSGAKPLAVGPVTLKMRINPAATGAERALEPGELPPQVDPRQMSLFGAGWTLGSLKYLAEAGAATLTYYETTGWRGVMETAAGSSQPDKFPSVAGQVFPLYHVLADVAEFAGGEVVSCVSSESLRVEALLLKKGARRRLILANLSDETRIVAVDPALLEGAACLRSTRLNAQTAAEALRSPVEFRRRAGEIIPRVANQRFELAPFELHRIDLEPTS